MLKVVKRTPHLITSKVGMAKSSNDAEIDDLKRRFTAVEEESAKLLKDAKAYREAVTKMLSSSHDFGQAYITLLSPMSNELDLPSKYPAASQTIEQMGAYQELITDLRDNLQPELDLIESRIISPVKEYLEIIKKAKKAITKRDHKLIDFDRFNNAYTKLRDKKEKTLKDEQNMFKAEQDYETALADYEYYNNLLRAEIPRLNVVYTTYEKLQRFSEGRFDFSQSDVMAVYQARLDGTNERIEALSITKRPTSTAKIIADRRQANGDGLSSRTSVGSLRPPPLSAKPSTTSLKPPPPLSSKPSFGNKPGFVPPKPGGIGGSAGLAPKPSLATKPSVGGGMDKTSFATEPPSVAVPPPYSPPTTGGVGSVAAAAAAFQAQRNGPSAPGLKPKPISRQESSNTVYVTALYDFAAQAAGDLSFSAGDRIEVIKRTDSEEDWWTGKLNGVEGIFPGNYVQS